MNKMKKNAIIDCSEQLSTQATRLDECVSILHEVISFASENDCGDDLNYLVSNLRTDIEEQAARVRRLSFVLSSAADTTHDNDKKSLQLCTTEAKFTNELSKTLVGDSSYVSGLNKLPSNFLKINYQ